MAKKLSKTKENEIRVLKDFSGYIYHETDETEIFHGAYPKFGNITEYVSDRELEELVSNYTELREPTRSEVIRVCLGKIVYKKRYLDLVQLCKKLIEDLNTKDIELSILFKQKSELEYQLISDDTPF